MDGSESLRDFTHFMEKTDAITEIIFVDDTFQISYTSKRYDYMGLLLMEFVFGTGCFKIKDCLHFFSLPDSDREFKNPNELVKRWFTHQRSET